MNGPPLVRLSRDGERAICAKCPELFASRITRSAIVLPGRRAVVPPALTSDMATLEFLPGWINQEGPSPEVLPGGVWRMSKRVRDRIAAGKQPAFRRRPQGGSSDGFSSWSPSARVIALPALVICPACGFRQIADEGVLHVAL